MKIGSKLSLMGSDSGFLPSQLTSLLVWLAADKITGLVNNDLVSTWTNAGNAGADATAAGTARPTYKTLIQNGLPAVRFNGTANTLSIAYSTLISTYSAYAAVNVTSFTNYPTIISKRTDGSNRNLYFLVRESVAGKVTNGFFSGVNAPQELSSTGVLTLSTSYVLGITFDNPNNEAFVEINGTIETAAQTNTPQDVGTAIAVGSSGGGTATEFFTGDIFEVILYNRALTTAERTLVRNYLNTKWAVY